MRRNHLDSKNNGFGLPRSRQTILMAGLGTKVHASLAGSYHLAQHDDIYAIFCWLDHNWRLVEGNLKSEVRCPISESRAQPAELSTNRHGRRCSARPGRSQVCASTCKGVANNASPTSNGSTRLGQLLCQINDFAKPASVQPRPL